MNNLDRTLVAPHITVTVPFGSYEVQIPTCPLCEQGLLAQRWQLQCLRGASSLQLACSQCKYEEYYNYRFDLHGANRRSPLDERFNMLVALIERCGKLESRLRTPLPPLTNVEHRRVTWLLMFQRAQIIVLRMIILAFGLNNTSKKYCDERNNAYVH